jgi:hypothetical protein
LGLFRTWVRRALPRVEELAPAIAITLSMLADDHDDSDSDSY